MGEQDSQRDAAGPSAQTALDISSLENYAKLLAVVGVVLYGILFYTYGRYFDELDARPEDVGVTYLFVLTRSIGLALIALILFIAWYLVIRLIFRLWPKLGCFRKPVAVAIAVVAAVLAGVFLSFRNALGGALLAIPITLITIPIWEFSRINPKRAGQATRADDVHQKDFLWSSSHREPRQAAAAPITITLGLAAVIVAVGFTLGIYANDMVHHARNGDWVKPWRILTFTMLDVQSTPARVTWIGPAGGEPEVLSQAQVAKNSTYKVRYLGASGGQTLLLVVGKGQAWTVRVPTADVEIETCRGSSRNSTDTNCHIP